MTDPALIYVSPGPVGPSRSPRADRQRSVDVPAEGRRRVAARCRGVIGWVAVLLVVLGAFGDPARARMVAEPGSRPVATRPGSTPAATPSAARLGSRPVATPLAARPGSTLAAATPGAAQAPATHRIEPATAQLGDLVILRTPALPGLLAEVGGKCEAIVLVLDGLPGTTLGSTLLDRNKQTSTEHRSEQICAELTKLQTEVEVLDQAKGSEPPSVVAAVTEAIKRQELSRLRAELRRIPAAIKPASTGFFKDLLNDANGPSIHRLQMFGWTIILGMVFCESVYQHLTMPEFANPAVGVGLDHERGSAERGSAGGEAKPRRGDTDHRHDGSDR